MNFSSCAVRLGLALGAFGATVVADRILGTAGFPSEARSYPVAPPHFQARIESLEYVYTRRTNDRGIRYRTIPLDKPAGTYRVVLLGDSFTEGACVEVEERWSDLIERRLAERGEQAVEMVNCGEAGTNPVDYARTLVQLGLDYEPDAVVVGIYFDDVPGTPVDVDLDALLSGRIERTGLAALVHALWPHVHTLLTDPRSAPVSRRRERPIGSIVELARRIARERGIEDAAFERWLAAVPAAAIEAVDARKLTPGLVTHALSQPSFFYEGIGIETPAARARLGSILGILDGLHRLCRERGIRFGVVLMPSVHQFDPRSDETLMASLFAAVGSPVREEWKSSTTAIQGELAAWAARENLPFLDLVPVFRAAVGQAERPLSFAIDPHWTPAGHRTAALAIHDWMESSGLLP